MRISIETPFIDADRFSFTLCLSSGSRFSGMLRFSDVDSGKWNSPAKFRTTGINRSRLNPIFFPSANFCLSKSKIKKKRGKKNREKFENLIKKIIAGKVDACEPERERDRPEWPRTKSGEKLCNWEQVSLHRWLERKSGGSSIFLAGCIRTAYRGGVPSPFQAFVASSSDPFFAPLPPKASGFEISNAVAGSSSPFNPSSRMPRMRSLPRWAEGREVCRGGYSAQK